MPTPDQIIGAITVDTVSPTATGTLIHATVEDLATGKIRDETIIAPIGADSWTRVQLEAWCRQTMLRRAQGWIDGEVRHVIEAMRQGKNPLRDSANSPIGTEHLTHAEAATRVYQHFAQASDPKDRVIAARLTQSLSDTELAAITGLDSVGIKALRDKAAAALQAEALMRQAGGSW